MAGGSESSSGGSTGQNLGSLFTAGLFGQPAFMGKKGLQFGTPNTNQKHTLGITNPNTVGSSPFTLVNTGKQGMKGGWGGVLGEAQEKAWRAPASPDSSQGFYNSGVGNVNPGGIAPQVFSPEDFGMLQNLLNPTESNFLQEFSPQMAGAMAAPFTQNISEGLSSGFRTDMSPVIAAEQSRLMNETIPEIAEQYAGITGGFSSDFGNAGLMAAKDMGLELGAMQSELDEGAAERRMFYGQHAPTALSSFAGIGDQLFESETLQRPEMQLLRNISNLFSLSPPSTGSGQKSHAIRKG